MQHPDPGEQLCDFLRTAIESPQDTIESITIIPGDYPLPLRPAVCELYHAVQDFLDELQKSAAATGQMDEGSESSFEKHVPDDQSIGMNLAMERQPLVPLFD